MSFRNRPVGFLIVFDRLDGDRPFNDEDERLLQAFAASAATAVATAQNASEEALRRSLEASEAERSRWARELHDETLQQLAGLRVLLAGRAPQRRPDAHRRGASRPRSSSSRPRSATCASLITDLRPAALDELGAEPALETLVERVARQRTRRSISRSTSPTRRRRASRHTPEIESTVYRLVQEALTNVSSTPARPASRCASSDADGQIEVVVRDDGRGFDPHRRSSGFGLVGMRERLALVHGTLDIDTTPGAGTALRASIPVRGRVTG